MLQTTRTSPDLGALARGNVHERRRHPRATAHVLRFLRMRVRLTSHRNCVALLLRKSGIGPSGRLSAFWPSPTAQPYSQGLLFLHWFSWIASQSLGKLHCFIHWREVVCLAVPRRLSRIRPIAVSLLRLAQALVRRTSEVVCGFAPSGKSFKALCSSYEGHIMRPCRSATSMILISLWLRLTVLTME
ncbi:hypothetical protein MRB53_037519 [Persea americana]|nr:hypothetical protein MRB53_037519 [Persea americana]